MELEDLALSLLRGYFQKYRGWGKAFSQLWDIVKLSSREFLIKESNSYQMLFSNLSEFSYFKIWKILTNLENLETTSRRQLYFLS